jgi:hypothetical protein
MFCLLICVPKRKNWKRYSQYFSVNTRVGADIRQFAVRLILQCQIATAISESWYSDIRKYSLHFLQKILLDHCILPLYCAFLVLYMQ